MEGGEDHTIQKLPDLKEEVGREVHLTEENNLSQEKWTITNKQHKTSN